jgi:hypothetical protein
MRTQVQRLRQLVLDSQYVVDEASLADAIIARATARRLVAGVAFRNDLGGPQVRSFRPSRHARSFRPCGVAVSSDGGGALTPAGNR